MAWLICCAARGVKPSLHVPVPCLVDKLIVWTGRPHYQPISARLAVTLASPPLLSTSLFLTTDFVGCREEASLETGAAYKYTTDQYQRTFNRANGARLTLILMGTTLQEVSEDSHGQGWVPHSQWDVSRPGERRTLRKCGRHMCLYISQVMYLLLGPPNARACPWYNWCKPWLTFEPIISVADFLRHGIPAQSQR